MKYLALILIFSSCIAYSQDFNLFEKKIFISSKGDTIPYRILYPENYNKTKKYPLVLFLHGGGEKGRDNEKQLLHGVKVFLDAENRKKFPCIVIAPQCMPDDSWTSSKTDQTVTPPVRDFNYTYPITKSLDAVQELVYDVIKKESVQKTGVYVTGLSMGAMATYEIVARNPGLFVAAAAICGGGDPNFYNKKTAGTKFWIFHGDADDVVDVKYSRIMNEKLKELKANVKYTEYPGVNHNSWDTAYAEPDLLPWMFTKNFKFNYK
jgi:predicted peptidase